MRLAEGIYMRLAEGENDTIYATRRGVENVTNTLECRI